MTDLSITFSVEHDALIILHNLFIGDYGRYQSPFFPIYMLSDAPKWKSISEYTENLGHSKFRIVESYEDPDQGFREIATVSVIFKPANEIRVTVEGNQEGKNRWYQVEKLVKSTLQFVYDHGYTIISASPFNIIPLEMYFPKKVSEEFEKFDFKVHPQSVSPEKEVEVDQIDLKRTAYSNSEIYIPKTKETLRKWKKAYKLMNRLKADWEKRYEELESNDPIPTDDYFREELIKIFGKKVSLKTIERIRKAGKEGLLK